MPAPSNDNFASAIALSTTLPASLTGLTTFDATQESGEVSLGTVAYPDQSIWFTFTPTTTGWYRFRAPLAEITYAGTFTIDDGSLEIAISAATTLAGYTTASLLDSVEVFTDPDWQAFPWATECNIAAYLTASTTYRIKCWSDQFNQFNRTVVNFNLYWDLLATPSNDNFANRTTISGSSGTQAFQCAAGSRETDEPYPFYWWTGFANQPPTVWYEWTCPATGYYLFTTEVDDTGNQSPILAIYTGSAVNALTPVAKNEGGAPDDALGPVTAVGFSATSGTVYKIQVAMSNATKFGGAGTLRWQTLATPVGDTTGTAASGFFTGRTDNYGHSDDEAPPNAVSRLSAHGDFYYTTGAVGRSKWWKFVAGANGSLIVEGNNYRQQTGYSEYALLVYKGADFASLTAATTADSEDAVMIGYSGIATTIAGDEWMRINYTSGETVWLCMVGLYDTDYAGVVAADCPQTDLDLTFGEFNDYETVNLNLTAGGSEIYDQANTEDAATVYLNLIASGTEGQQFSETGTVYLDLGVQGGECFSTFSGLMFGEGDAVPRWFGDAEPRWFGEADPRWGPGEATREGINC